MDSSSSSHSETANPINAIALPIFCVISILITYLPFRAFKRLGNFPACNIVIVNDVINIFYMVNAILWPNDDLSAWWLGYGLCDIEASLKFPLTLALATSLCRLTQGMANALDVDNAQLNTTAAMKRRRLVLDIVLCWGAPLFEICLHYIVQNGRYAIVPVFGCGDQLDNSWPIIPIYLIWIPLLMILNLYYAALILIRLRKHRKNISGALTTTGSGMGPKKFIKIILIVFSLLIIYLPVQAVFFVRMLPPEIIHYSWSRIHEPASWDPVLLFHTSDFPAYQYYGWASVAWNITIFLFFGFNDEAINIYRGWMVKCGLGKIWPSLKEPRQARRPGYSSRTSLSSHCDLVGKAIHYFDVSTRTESQTSTRDGQGSESSRKGSQGTFDHTALTKITTNVSNKNSQHPREVLSPNSSSHPSHYMSDLITPAPLPAKPAVTPSPLRPELNVTMPVKKPGNIISTFRTHISLQTSLFPQSPKRTSKPSRATINFPPISQPSFTNFDTDIEAQHPSLVLPTTVSTQIWSSSCHSTMQPSNSTHASHPGRPFAPPSSSHATTYSQHLDPDPFTPKAGTRAYREREKRGFERQKEAEKRETTRVLADNFRVAMGLELLSGEVNKGKGKEKEGVVVKTSFERQEEDT